MVDDDLLWLVVVERGQSNWLCSSGEYSVRWGLSGRQDTHRWRNLPAAAAVIPLKVKSREGVVW